MGAQKNGFGGVKFVTEFLDDLIDSCVSSMAQANGQRLCCGIRVKVEPDK